MTETTGRQAFRPPGPFCFLHFVACDGRGDNRKCLQSPYHPGGGCTSLTASFIRDARRRLQRALLKQGTRVSCTEIKRGEALCRAVLG
ncbi:hypothetical protein SKAU_G00345630 [Synaphobranchus kaupii]|uniref:Uncharacterized protein n=1 Tax=Synaphobranchus kaupii TaxID=118154 RepID=A0A9Q1IGQ1_SYNKA|nr:hypothetical protein SKAU_G00345630 [Synaphobranchus kaupii]